MRKIPPGRRTITGKLPSRYTGGLLQYESRLERNFLILLEAEPGIKKVETQAVQLELEINGRKRRYTPDVLVTWHDHAQWPYGVQQVIFEVKPYDILKREFADLRPKYRAAKHQLAAQGCGFRVVTERSIDTPKLRNAEQIIAHFDRQPPAALYVVARTLFEQARGPLQLNTLLNALGQAGAAPYQSWSAVWHWIGCGFLHCDRRLLVQPTTVVEWWTILTWQEIKRERAEADRRRQGLG